MIRTVSDLLESLLEHENRVLKQQNVKHAPTIGDMYEGLTQDLLGSVLPSVSGIDVCGGFITDESGSLSSEIDCMVVTAPGTAIPHTYKRTFLLDDVVAVVQVKKNLYAKDLLSGWENLCSIRQFNPTRDRGGDLFEDAFRGTTRCPLPSSESFDSLPYATGLVYDTLAMDLCYPAQIIFAYNGYASEVALRRSFAKYLEDQVCQKETKGFGVPSLPALICCGTHSFVKADGMPFISPIDEDGYWPVYGSTTGNPLYLLLEVVWTRLVYDGHLPSSMFDDDSFLQPLNRLIDARPFDGRGWEYRLRDSSKERILEQNEPVPWSPVTLDEAQFTMISRLCGNGEVKTSDPEFREYVECQGRTVEDFVQSLRETGLVGLEGQTLVMLTRDCQCVILPDGTIVAAENCSGKLTRWLSGSM